MKRIDLIRHLVAEGCELLREGARHSVFVNRKSGKASTVPRHREIHEFLAFKICRDRKFVSLDLGFSCVISPETGSHP